MFASFSQTAGQSGSIRANRRDDDPVRDALDNRCALVERPMCDTRGVALQANPANRLIIHLRYFFPQIPPITKRATTAAAASQANGFH